MWICSWLLLGKSSNGVWDFDTLLQHPCFRLSWEVFYAFDKLVAWGRGQALMRLQKQIYTTWFPESQLNVSFVPYPWKLNTSHMQEAGFLANRRLEPTLAFASATLRPNPLGLCSFNKCLKRPVFSFWFKAHIGSGPRNLTLQSLCDFRWTSDDRLHQSILRSGCNIWFSIYCLPEIPWHFFLRRFWYLGQEMQKTGKERLNKLKNTYIYGLWLPSTINNHGKPQRRRDEQLKRIFFHVLPPYLCTFTRS